MDMNSLFGKFQEMQKNMQEVRERLDTIEVTGEAGGGMVRATMTCTKRLIKLHVDEDIRKDPEMMEDLICAAVNKASELAEEQAKKEMQEATQGMLPNIPGMDLSQFGL